MCQILKAHRCFKLYYQPLRSDSCFKIIDILKPPCLNQQAGLLDRYNQAVIFPNDTILQVKEIILKISDILSGISFDKYACKIWLFNGLCRKLRETFHPDSMKYYPLLHESSFVLYLNLYKVCMLDVSWASFTLCLNMAFPN